MSSDDFDGPAFRPAGGRGADEHSGGNGAAAPGAGASGNAGPGAGKRQYPAPEGWETDGFWRDSAIDSDYETGLTNAIRPAKGAPHDDPGYSYFSDSKGWETSPAKGSPAGDATSLDATRANFGSFGRGDATRMDMRGQGGGHRRGDGGYFGNRTAVYRAGAGGPGGQGYGPGGPGWRRPGGPYGPGGWGGKRFGKWNWLLHWSWKKAGVVVAGAFVLIVIATFGVYQYMSSSTVIPAALASADYQSTQVYYSDGKTLMGTIGTFNRHNLTFNQIPKDLQDAVLAAEDKNFWTEGGISPTGILRAAMHDVTSGGSLNGGSTITQEFVRNYYDGIGTQQTASRKIREIFIAQKLAQQKTKQWILTNYLNVIPLGDHALGVAAAAQTYFGIPVDQLSKMTISQAAVIAGIIQQPGFFPLPANRAALVTRWHYVLGQMVKDGFITQGQADAQKFPTMLTDKNYNPNTGTSFSNEDSGPWVSYVLNVVQNEIEGVDGVTQAQLETAGLKIVTTISRPMEAQLYKSVRDTLTSANIKGTAGATVSSVPNWVRVGAELQDPKTGSIIAMYPGPGQNMSAAKCKQLDCQLNTAVYTREQVGSSFKPYVLATAVSQGMNVQTSILNANTVLCVPPDSLSRTLSKTMPSYSTKVCKQAGLNSYFPVQNDGGEVIGNAKQGFGVSPQTALALSSNTAFTDLTHRVTTASVTDMAAQFGVNTSAYPNGSGLATGQFQGAVGIALGIAPLTVNEQATTLATIADNGQYHTAHLIKYWTLGPDGSNQMPKVQTRAVLSADQDSQVQYAMEATTTIGTGTNAAVGLGNRQIIAKTGTTTNSHSGFFLGAIQQYALVVGMFTKSGDTNSADNLSMLGGGGFGGYWPAKIWNSFATAEFANLPMENFQTPQFSGSKWVQIGALPKKSQCTVTFGGRRIQIGGKGCRNGQPTPTPGQTGTPTGKCHPAFRCPPTPSAGPTPGGFPTVQSTPTVTTPTGLPTGQGTPSTTPTVTATTPGVGNATVAGVRTGLAFGGAFGGALAVLPGTLLPGALLWRRRRRRRSAE